MASASAGIGSALPSQVGQSGNYLTTDGTVATWATVSAGGGVTTMAAVGAVPNANGASISSVTLTLQPADATNPGVVTTGTQTIAGAKTLSGAVTASAGFLCAGNAPTTTTAQAALGSTSSVPGLWLGVGASGLTNYAIVGGGTAGGTLINDGAVGNISFRLSNVEKARLAGTSWDLTGLGTSGSIKLKSPDGTTYTLTVANGGSLVIT